MPIYEFNCTQCGNQWDELLKQSDPDPDVCPKCGKASVQRWVSAAAFRLKGAGWYETDFKNEGDSKRNLAGDSAADAAAEKPAAEPAKTDKPGTETAAPEKSADKSTEKPKVAAAAVPAPAAPSPSPSGDGGSKA